MVRDALRPSTLDEYIGQDNIKGVLRTAIESAKIRKAPLDHVLLSGPPGLGKTTLAQIIANEMKWKFVTILAPSMGTVAGVTANFTRVEPNSIVFLDEIHRLRKNVQESLYPVLEDGRVSSWTGFSYIELPVHTVVGATTNEGRLERPFVDRFALPFRLEYYTDEELSTILGVNAKKLELSMGPEAVLAIARRAKSTPRIGNNLLRRIQDYSLVRGVQITEAFVEEVLWDQLGIDEFGLHEQDREYLQALEGNPSGLGADSLATLLNEDIETVEDSIEPFLIRLSFVMRQRNGRIITEAGMDYLNGKARVPEGV